MDMVFNGVWVVEILDENACQLYIIILGLLTWCKFDFFVERVLVSHEIFVDVVKVNLVLDFIDDESDSSECFIEVIIVPDVADGVKEPGEEELCFIKVVDFFYCLLDFFYTGFFAFFFAES